jgi:hypothetical protein
VENTNTIHTNPDHDKSNGKKCAIAVAIKALGAKAKNPLTKPITNVNAGNTIC